MPIVGDIDMFKRQVEQYKKKFDLFDEELRSRASSCPDLVSWKAHLLSSEHDLGNEISTETIGSWRPQLNSMQFYVIFGVTYM